MSDNNKNYKIVKCDRSGQIILNTATGKEAELGALPFWKNKVFWTVLVTGLVGLYNSLSPIVGLPSLPSYVITILAALGLYQGKDLIRPLPSQEVEH
jgi:hypothetical protein